MFKKTKVMAFSGTKYKISKIVTGSELIEKVSSFNFLGCEIAYLENRDMEGKVTKFQHVCVNN
jgi:hypothetical protein